MLGPFNHTPPPGEDTKIARAVAWVTLALVLLMTLLSVVLPPSDTDLPQESVHQEAGSSQDSLSSAGLDGHSPPSDLHAGLHRDQVVLLPYTENGSSADPQEAYPSESTPSSQLGDTRWHTVLPGPCRA
jgi:hypothetical protein